ncbi:hypothetical protein RJP21_30185 [Paenibacillus sp. VCA1]|uniref:hypothetical protein n=1 Tax=Paenibacillus sp. VCA1 TaxID=3039148 RepID=UPI0028729F8F|nr:hypothetical protein [Paenibacillus sp. VCA1]MDR9857866.1 hypothetical protein [Paenibacillus sp. VCA1]
MAEKTKHYHVIHSFVDKDTDEIIAAGSIYEADEERAAQLKAADVIGKEATKAEVDAAMKKDAPSDGVVDAGDA